MPQAHTYPEMFLKKGMCFGYAKTCLLARFISFQESHRILSSFFAPPLAGKSRAHRDCASLSTSRGTNVWRTLNPKP